MPRRRNLPDRRPTWNDPNLICIRDYTMGNGEHKLEVDENYERRYREFLMQTSAHPGWKSDPTYNLRRRNGNPNKS